MTFTCQNCGSMADKPSSLCNPTADKVEGKFCGTSTDKVCEDKYVEMNFLCDACGGLSPDPQHLCSPRKIH